MPHTLLPSTSSARAPTVTHPFGCVLRDSGLDTAWVRVVGVLDVATAPELEEALRRAELLARRIVLDLRELTFMDSSGVHLILSVRTRVRDVGGRLVLVRGPSHVDQVLTLTGASQVLEIVDLEPRQPPVQALVKLAQQAATSQQHPV